MNEISESRRYIWINGQFVGASEARISPFDRGFQYGDGAFETIRADNGSPHFLREHLNRLKDALTGLRLPFDAGIYWIEIIRDLLRKNLLDNSVARVKIAVTRGVAPGKGLPAPQFPTILITAESYIPPSDIEYSEGWKLHLVDDFFPASINRLKTLNYLSHLYAQQIALDHGADEALFLDAYGNIAETGTASLLLRTNGSWWYPASKFQLKGITREKIIALLERRGYTVTERAAGLEALFEADTIWTANSMIGVMPVAEINGKEIPNPDPGFAGEIREEIFSLGK